MDEDIYVIVTETPGFDGFANDSNLAPFIYETGIKHSLTLANAQRLIKDIPKRFGKCRIAKLVFQCEHDFPTFETGTTNYVKRVQCRKCGHVKPPL